MLSPLVDREKVGCATKGIHTTGPAGANTGRPFFGVWPLGKMH